MQIVNRSQRRMNKKNFLLPLFVLVVATISFFLGVAVGRGRSSKIPSLPPATVLPPTAPAKTAAKDLTFYDTLPKGEQIPLGSGINLPRESSASVDPTAAAAATAMPSAEPFSAPAATLAPAPPVTSTQAAAAKSAPAHAARTGNGRWVIQVASYKAAEDARRMQKRLVGNGFQAAINEVDLADKGRWFRVVLGPYSSDTEANQIASRLQNDGITGLVRKD